MVASVNLNPFFYSPNMGRSVVASQDKSTKRSGHCEPGNSATREPDAGTTDPASTTSDPSTMLGVSDPTLPTEPTSVMNPASGVPQASGLTQTGATQSTTAATPTDPASAFAASNMMSSTGDSSAMMMQMMSQMMTMMMTLVQTLLSALVGNSSDPSMIPDSSIAPGSSLSDVTPKTDGNDGLEPKKTIPFQAVLNTDDEMDGSGDM